MAEKVKKAKMANRKGLVKFSKACPKCENSELRPAQFTGYGPHGMFWICAGKDGKYVNACDYSERIAK